MSTYSQSKFFQIFWPIAISIFLSNMMAFIDSAMIANYSTVSLNAINIANQIKFVFGPMYFGILSGLSIYTAQAIGRKDRSAVSQTFGFGVILIAIISTINFLVILFFSSSIIDFFVDVNSKVGDEALSFLRVTIINTIFWPISMLFMYQFRSIKRPKIPLIINTSMLVTNSCLNLLLIYGIGPFPSLGVVGAGIATVFSVFVFILVYIIVAIKVNAEFVNHPKVMFGFTWSYARKVLNSILPLIVIELFYGISRIAYSKIYLLVGLEAYTLNTVATNITNLVNAGVIATASTAGIIIGEALGNGEELKPIKQSLFKFMFKVAAIMFVVICALLPFLMPLYKPNDVVISNFYYLVYVIMIINAVYMVIRVFSSTLISILKSGGDTKVVILADPLSSYLIGIPFTLIGFYVFNLGIVGLKILSITEILGKLFISYYFYKQNKWAKKL